MIMSMSEAILPLSTEKRYLPEKMVIHRLTGDGDKKTLIAPEWSKDKKRVLNALHKAIREKERE